MNNDTVSARVLIRRLRPGDLESVVALDARETGRRRDEYFRVKLDQAMNDTGVEVSLAAELDGLFVGFLLSRVYYGEFGATEKTAVLDTLGVHPDFRGSGVGRGLLRQLRTNLMGLGIGRLQTEVSWADQDLMSFFQHAGFEPAARFCLDLDLQRARVAEGILEAAGGQQGGELE